MNTYLSLAAICPEYFTREARKHAPDAPVETPKEEPGSSESDLTGHATEVTPKPPELAQG